MKLLTDSYYRDVASTFKKTSLNLGQVMQIS